MELRNYQVECLNKINELQEGAKNIIEIATGGGKTVIFSKLIAETKGRCIVVIDQEELLQQSVSKLIAVGVNGEDIGRVKGVLDEVNKQYLVATRQSLTHQQKKIIDGIGAKYVLGFSATPYATGIEKVYEDILFKKDILSLVKEGYLVSPRALVCESNVSLDGISMTLGDFNQKELNERIDIEDRNKFIVELNLN